MEKNRIKHSSVNKTETLPLIINHIPYLKDINGIKQLINVYKELRKLHEVAFLSNSKIGDI